MKLIGHEHDFSKKLICFLICHFVKKKQPLTLRIFFQNFLRGSSRMAFFRDQAQGHLQLQQRAALPHLLMALSLVLALTLVLALVRNNIFSKVRVLVLNQPIRYAQYGQHAQHGGHSRKWS